MGKGLRFSIVPWLADAVDLRPMGEPETTVEHGQTIIHGLDIPSPFGPSTDAVLTVTATRGNGNDGGVISMAITDEIHADIKPAMDMTLLSGTVRRRWDPGDPAAHEE
jgi:hypothetical protein